MVATAVGTFTGAPASLLRLMGVGASSRPFLASVSASALQFENDFEVVSDAQSTCALGLGGGRAWGRQGASIPMSIALAS